MKKKKSITLVSKGMVNIGTIFIHKGEGSKCLGCEYFRICVENLEKGRVYEVVEVRDKTFFCRLFEANMRVVEVVNAKMYVNVPSKKAIAGAIIEFNHHECTINQCDKQSFCFPEGLYFEDKCRIIEVIEDVYCPIGLPLKKTFLELVRV